MFHLSSNRSKIQRHKIFLDDRSIFAIKNVYASFYLGIHSPQAFERLAVKILIYNTGSLTFWSIMDNGEDIDENSYPVEEW
jgi:hypothetical protein